ncbi:MAG TPA: hypothetical protein VFK38_04185 [Candidatus Limnocylindrales bacterium]|nr:hypothetical protein [Candidatus Limnocylindrales bacterium]
MIDRLEQELAAMASEAFPPTPTLAAPVVARIEDAGLRPPRWYELDGAFRLRRSTLLAVGASLLLAGVVLAAGYVLGPLRVLFVETLPTVPATASPTSGGAIGASLGLGRRMTLEEARRLAGFELRLPTIAGLGPPDAVYRSERLPGGLVAFVWRATPERPAVLPGSDAGLVLTASPARLDPALLKKLVSGETDVQWTVVRGGAALWITGRPHVLLIDVPGAGRMEETVRLVGDVLVWERDGIFYRLESALPLERVLPIAESLP